MGPKAPATYAAAGVDIDAGDEVVRRIKRMSTSIRPEVIAGIGGFAGGFAFDRDRYRDPVLVASTDGVGTKVAIAVATGRFDGIGHDLVAMCVDDLVCMGAEPLFFLDYISTGQLDADRVAAIVASVSSGCARANCALLGGETAEHPGLVEADHIDLAGFAVGVVDRGSMLGAERVHDGDVVIGLHSPGLRSNGYSLVRHVLFERAGLDLAAPAWPGATQSLADELLVPSVIYAPGVLAVSAALGDQLHAAAHITGGGIAANLARSLPGHLQARLERDRWPEPRIFSVVADYGQLEEAEMDRVFNRGLGMALLVDPAGTETALAALAADGLGASVVGSIEPGTGGVVIA